MIESTSSPSSAVSPSRTQASRVDVIVAHLDRSEEAWPEG